MTGFITSLNFAISDALTKIKAIAHILGPSVASLFQIAQSTMVSGCAWTEVMIRHISLHYSIQNNLLYTSCCQ